MSIQGITTKVISTLGNKESLVPIMIKDGVDSTSLTLKSFKEGGLVEGIDRGIDEYGTQAIWIGGIPAYKKIFDWTVYKLAKINPKVDPRVIANKEYAAWAKENAQGFISEKGETVKDALNKCLEDGGKKAKNLYTGKVIAATALTLATFFLMTKGKQKNTKDTVIRDLNNNTINSNNDVLMYSKPDEMFDKFSLKDEKEKDKPSFKGIVNKVVEGVMFNPVHNMKIIDAGITTERIACSRNKVEFAEHSIKEGAFLFFVYGFGNLIEKGINKFSNKVLNKPIDLDIDVLMDGKLKEALSKGKIAEDLSKLPEKSKSLTDKLNFIVENPDNIIVQAAKKSKVVSTVKDAAGNSVVDTSKFIDTGAVEKIAENLGNISKKFVDSGETVDKFLAKTKGLKVASVAANVGISCLFLGYLIPKAIYKYREWKTGTTSFHVANDIKKENENKKTEA
ncbi:hypothetical protein II906_10820 [bacterium]|nr:hypothetical protein [bacterium]